MNWLTETLDSASLVKLKHTVVIRMTWWLRTSVSAVVPLSKRLAGINRPSLQDKKIPRTSEKSVRDEAAGRRSFQLLPAFQEHKLTYVNGPVLSLDWDFFLQVSDKKTKN